jgi:hypothetical protein
MPSTPHGPKPDPMSREVDRLLAQLGDRGSERSRDPESRERASASRPPFRSRGRGGTRPKAGEARYDRLGLWARLALGAALGGLITQWPYARACDWALLGYLGAVAMVLLAGGWIAIASWRLRDEVAHAASLILFFWGLVLAADQLLPRIGYAAVEAGWRCGPDARTLVVPERGQGLAAGYDYERGTPGAPR